MTPLSLSRGCLWGAWSGQTSSAPCHLCYLPVWGKGISEHTGVSTGHERSFNWRFYPHRVSESSPLTPAWLHLHTGSKGCLSVELLDMRVVFPCSHNRQPLPRQSFLRSPVNFLQGVTQLGGCLGHRGPPCFISVILHPPGKWTNWHSFQNL